MTARAARPCWHGRAADPYERRRLNQSATDPPLAPSAANLPAPTPEPGSRLTCHACQRCRRSWARRRRKEGEPERVPDPRHDRRWDLDPLQVRSLAEARRSWISSWEVKKRATHSSGSRPAVGPSDSFTLTLTFGGGSVPLSIHRWSGGPAGRGATSRDARVLDPGVDARHDDFRHPGEVIRHSAIDHRSVPAATRAGRGVVRQRAPSHRVGSPPADPTYPGDRGRAPRIPISTGTDISHLVIGWTRNTLPGRSFRPIRARADRSAVGSGSPASRLHA